MADVRLMDEFTIERNDKQFKVRFTPISGRWWDVSIHEANGHLIKHSRKPEPPNFTNAIRFLDKWVPDKKASTKKKKKRFQPRLKVVK